MNIEKINEMVSSMEANLKEVKALLSRRRGIVKAISTIEKMVDYVSDVGDVESSVSIDIENRYSIQVSGAANRTMLLAIQLQLKSQLEEIDSLLEKMQWVISENPGSRE